MNDPYMLVGNGFDTAAMPLHPGGRNMARLASDLKPRKGTPMPVPPPPPPDVFQKPELGYPCEACGTPYFP